MEIEQQMKEKLNGALTLLNSVNDDINVLWHEKRIDSNSSIFGQMNTAINNVKYLIEEI